ncbi:hypothetical protein F2Q68_00003785 [Brassica cretica]|uniref:Uncharacterized protein n=1 Tax=Brassica cretica TaxID=69181 RepID=A0A8S9JBD0_BRACR|nr:hypothetical protein F2Q68_00003785 [Brassica cretica]
MHGLMSYRLSGTRVQSLRSDPFRALVRCLVFPPQSFSSPVVVALLWSLIYKNHFGVNVVIHSSVGAEMLVELFGVEFASSTGYV